MMGQRSLPAGPSPRCTLGASPDLKVSDTSEQLGHLVHVGPAAPKLCTDLRQSMFIPWRSGLAEAHPLTCSRWWQCVAEQGRGALAHSGHAQLSHLELQR